MPNSKAVEPIAITGLALRLPNAKSKEAYWDNLIKKKNAIRHVSDYRKALANRPNWSSFFGELEDIDLFDYHFFDMKYEHVKFMDPQQRLSMELAYEVLEDAGMLSNQHVDERAVGVYMSNCVNSYNKLVIDYVDQHGKAGLGSEFMMGCIDSALTSQITHYFNFVGPAYHVNSACSSFVVQLDIALKDLYSKSIEGALIIASNILSTDFISDLTEAAGIISKGDKCSVFDANADGTIVGEGLVGIYIETKEHALKNNRNIYGLIRGVGINNDGCALSLTSPNPKRQYEAMKMAYKKSQVAPHQISYIEAHGTGTVIGDPIEFNAMSKLFDCQTDKKIGIGAAKTNVGHLLGVAGGVGLSKVLMSLKHKTIAPTINLNHINPNLVLDKTPFSIITESTPWHSVGPRYAGLNCFGIGGTNTHLIIQEFLEERTLQAPILETPFTFSAKTEVALKQIIENVRPLIEDCSQDAHAIKATLNRYRKHYKYRAYGRLDKQNRLSIKQYHNISSNVGIKLFVYFEDIQSEMFNIPYWAKKIKKLKEAMGKRLLLGAKGHAQVLLSYIAGNIELKALTSALATYTDNQEIIEDTPPRHTLKLNVRGDSMVLQSGLNILKKFSYEEDTFEHLIGELFIRGAAFDWSVFHPDHTFIIQTLPSYPFESKSVWIDQDEPE